MCTSGHLLDRCARRLTLLNPFEGDDDDDDDESDHDENDMQDGRADEDGVGLSTYQGKDTGRQGAATTAAAPRPLRPELWRCGACQRSTLASPLPVASALHTGGAATDTTSSLSLPNPAAASPSSSSWTPLAWLSTAAGAFADSSSSSSSSGMNCRSAHSSRSEKGKILRNAAAERTCLLCSTTCILAPI